MDSGFFQVEGPVGTTSSTNGDISNHHGQKDLWVVKLNPEGGIVWQKCLGGSLVEGGYSIAPTSDGGLVVAGYAYSTDGDLTENKGIQDIWVVKLSAESVGAVSPVALEVKALEIFPNPAQQSVTIHIPQGSVFQAIVLDIQGREVLRQAAGNIAALDVSMLNRGVYFVQARCSDGAMATGRFVKE
jgi:Secretion system C-terminal sorting domain